MGHMALFIFSSWDRVDVAAVFVYFLLKMASPLHALTKRSMLLCTNQSGMLNLPRSLGRGNLHRDDQIWKRIVKRNVGKSWLEEHRSRDSQCYMYVVCF